MLELVLDVYTASTMMSSTVIPSSPSVRSCSLLTTVMTFTLLFLHRILSSHSAGKHLRDLAPAVNMIEQFVTNACASCGLHFKPKAAQHKKCDGYFSRRDNKTPKLSLTDTDVSCSGKLQAAS